MRELGRCLAPAHFVNSDHPDVVAWANEHGGKSTDPRKRAVSLFYAVRDGLRYDAYNMSLDPAAYQASAIAADTIQTSPQPLRPPTPN